MAIYVSGFDFGTSERSIQEHFEQIAEVSSVELVGSGASVVRFADPSAARRAVDEMNETTIEGNRRYINVKIDGEKGKGKGKKGGKDSYDRGFGKGGGKDYDRGYGGKGKDYDRGFGGKGGGRPYEDRTTYSGEFEEGTVAKFLTDRGFGYITPDNGENDLFVHFSAICSSGFRELSEGQRVRFGVEEDPKGKGKGGGKAMRAVAVSVI